MRIAVIGSQGQLGTALQSSLPGEIVPLDRTRIDIGDAEGVATCLRGVRPDVVVNAAAYNFVDKAESEPAAAHRVNALGPKLLANYCDESGATLVHVSTDYVFTGRTAARPWTEDDEPEPVSVYATGKLAGENNVRAACERHFIVRTCGLYGRATSPGKGNFVKTMLRLSAERDELRIVNDQRCTPTSAADLAGWIAALIPTRQHGLYHATNSGECTWFEFASEIFRIAGRHVNIVPISTAEFGAVARRPACSVLDCAKLQRTLGVTFRSWHEALAAYVAAERRG